MRDQLTKVNVSLFSAFVIFSWGSWIDIMGVMSEVPLMIPYLPEGWSLPIKIAVCVQVPFVALVVVMTINWLWPQAMRENLAIYAILTLGTLSMTLLAACWDQTVTFSGRKHSVALFVLSVVLGIVDNASSVVFFPYAKRFPLIYLRAMFVGEGLTGMIPAVLKIIQGGAVPLCQNQTRVINNTVYLSQVEVFTEPRFSVGTFLGVLSVVLASSLVAFIAIEVMPEFRRVRRLHLESQAVRSDEAATMLSTDEQRKKICRFETTKPTRLWLLVQTFFSSFALWGIVYSIYTYSLLPYGYAVTNASIILMNGLRLGAYFLASLAPLNTRSKIILVTAFSTGTCIYLTLCAVYSPCPPLINTTFGGILAAFCLVAADFTMTWVRTCVGDILMLHGGNEPLYFGMCTNVGIFIGAICCLIVDLKYELLKSRNFCLPLRKQCGGFRERFLG